MEAGELGEAGHFPRCRTYPLGQAVVGTHLPFAERAMTNLGLSALSPGTHTLLPHQGVCCIEQAGGGD